MSDDLEIGAARRAVAQALDSRAKAIIEQERAERTANMERLREARLKMEAAEAAEKAKADRKARDRLARQKRTAKAKLARKATPAPEQAPAPITRRKKAKPAAATKNARKA